MKVSKVNHTKSGVGVEKQKVQGMLYQSPARNQNAGKNLENHIHGLNDRGRNLYSVFLNGRITFTRDEVKTKQCKKMAELFRDFKRQVLNKYKKEDTPEANLSRQLKRLNTWLDEKRAQNKSDEISSELIESYVDNFLRNSLRKEAEGKYFPDLLKQTLRFIFQGAGATEASLSEAEQRIFMRILNRDYWKTDEIKKIAKSIEGQNVRVQVVEQEGRYLLQPSCAGHKSKKYVFQFMKRFADAADKKAREELLVHFKQLVLLYYCGRDKYEASLAVPPGAWDWGSYREEDVVNFDDRAYALLNELLSHQDKEAKKEKKEKKRKLQEEMKLALRHKIAERYREAVKAEGITEEDIFWLQYIEKSAEKLLKGKRMENPVHLSVFYLCDHTYREWISYICMKYIDMGKGVYHFATPEDMAQVPCGDSVIGEVREEYTKGITSFDYERIKAEESLHRELSLYIAFAVNNFARSIMSTRKNTEDVLSVSMEKIEMELYPDAERRILRFFGGQSNWRDCGLTGMELVREIREKLKTVRNSSFHYTVADAGSDQECPLLLQMFQKEHQNVGALYRKKYYSNNLLCFYSRQDITALMDSLYGRPKGKPSQVPSFQRILNKANLKEYITQGYIRGKKRNKLEAGERSLERMEKFRAALYFVLKEIYYHGFLQADCKERFLALVDKAPENQNRQQGRNAGTQAKENEEAHQDFSKRVREITRNNAEITFGEICQLIMTDYNQQNQGNKTVTSNKKGHDKEKYKHFRMLLYKYIRDAFMAYLKEQDVYQFLRDPEPRESIAQEISVEEFCGDWQPHLYDSLQEEISSDDVLLAWYTTAHFLNPKQLNLVSGCIRNYLQYVWDINRRAGDTRNVVRTVEGQEQYYKILSVFDFVMPFCGNVSNCLEDYFEDEDQYAEYLSRYVQFGQKGYHSGTALKEFCERPVKGSPSGTFGIYYDGKNPIVNRNVVYAGMYGNEKLFEKCFAKIAEKDIGEYYKLMEELKPALIAGCCEDIAQEKKMRKFQNCKNHVELTDITIYSEIINDLIGQLISWAYLRERDLMYFQLGFYYTKLYHGSSIPPESELRRMEGEGVGIREGAVLYQLIAVYTYDLPMIQLDENRRASLCVEKGGSIGEKIGVFLKKYCPDGRKEVYEAGLCLFEDVDRDHDDMAEFRRYIDHFKYFSNLDRSIMELYSDMYDRFLDYDIKLRKSVSYIFQNILMRYFVLARTNLSEERRKRYGGKIKEKERCVKISIAPNGLDSDEFKQSSNNMAGQASSPNPAKGKRPGPGSNTSPRKTGNKREDNLILARNDAFLAQLQKILEYKNE